MVKTQINSATFWTRLKLYVSIQSYVPVADNVLSTHKHPSQMPKILFLSLVDFQGMKAFIGTTGMQATMPKNSVAYTCRE